MDEINQSLQESLPENGPVIIWGAGQLTMKLLCETVLATHTIAAIVDSNPIHHGTMIQGARVLSPEELQQSGLDAPIVIGTLLHGRDIIAGIRGRYRLPNRLIELCSRAAVQTMVQS